MLCRFFNLKINKNQDSLVNSFAYYHTILCNLISSQVLQATGNLSSEKCEACNGKQCLGRILGIIGREPIVMFPISANYMLTSSGFPYLNKNQGLSCKILLNGLVIFLKS